MSHSTSSPHGRDAEIADVLHRTRATLRRIELALDNFPNVPDRERAVAAMHNVVVTGRSVTFVLKNMQHIAPNFQAWYKPWEDEMRQDPLLQYFKNLRNKIEKQGREGVATHGVLHSSDEFYRLPPAPPNTIGTFFGDKNGGSGWEVRLEDGSIQTIYFKLPKEVGRTWIGFEGLPNEHLGAPITDNSLEHVCALYVQYLRRLVEAAEERFGPTA